MPAPAPDAPRPTGRISGGRVRNRRVSTSRYTFARKVIWAGGGGVASVGGMSNALLNDEPEAATRGFLVRHLADDGFLVVADDEAGEDGDGKTPDLVLLGDADALER